MKSRHRLVAAFYAGPKMSLYYTSKAFVRSFSGVSVLAVCPGPTATGFEKATDMKGAKMFPKMNFELI